MDFQEDPRVKAASLEREFNRARYGLYRKVQRYFRQPITGNVIDESELIDRINKCRELRDQYDALKKELGLPPYKKK